jgi:2-deoxy-D-gluconate 3-dehydrogenase
MSKILEKFKLDGKVAVVTGASRGLGQGMAIALADAGADIAAVYTNDCSQTSKAIEARGRRCLLIKADIGKTASAGMIIEKTVQALGHIDILVNNAGIIRRAAFVDFSEKDWDDVMNVNLKGLFLLGQAAAKQMIRQGKGGKIINVASMLAFQGGIRVCSYTASKSAIIGLTRAMTNELAGQGINVNAIAPGYMVTDNTQALRDDAKRNAEILARIPSGRWGVPGDLDGAVVFLASAASDYVNGYAVGVDGGWLAR